MSQVLTTYVFLWKRPKDREGIAVVYTDKTRAEVCEFRVSEITEVTLKEQDRDQPRT